MQTISSCDLSRLPRFQFVRAGETEWPQVALVALFGKDLTDLDSIGLIGEHLAPRLVRSPARCGACRSSPSLVIADSGDDPDAASWYADGQARPVALLTVLGVAVEREERLGEPVGRLHRDVVADAVQRPRRVTSVATWRIVAAVKSPDRRRPRAPAC